MGVETADFSGYATKAGLKCSDGRTITPEAFKHMDGVKVPLVWQHGHNSADNVLGHALLEARKDGVYAYGFFNGTKQGQNAKALVQHGDVSSLSIYANALTEKVIRGAKQVLHGMIREVSLVLSGANPGALIDFVAIQHGDDPDNIEQLSDEAIIFTGLAIQHSNSEDELDDEEEEEDLTVQHAGTAGTTSADKTVQDVYDSLTPEQKTVVHYMIGAALESVQSNSATHSDVEGDHAHTEGTNMTTRNVFEQQGQQGGGGTATLRHQMSEDDVRGIVQDAMKLGSLRDAVEGYALKHGIDNIDVLFPDAQTVENMPQFQKRRTEWVQGVLNGAKHSPFARVKTLWADLTQADARAKGYITGHYKVEEWFAITKRVTTPTTIYKKQRLDRDDVVDITSFDVVAWIKQEMRLMLEEELARAILIGDGRAVSDEDKIRDPMGAPAGDGIRSILNDHELFTTNVRVNVGATPNYDLVVDAVMDGMEYYKGTGTPTLYTTIRQLNKFFKAKDTTGRRLYNNKAEVAAALGVADVVTVDPMNDLPSLIGIIVNLEDYTIGADKGGEVSTFENFDIDYNQQKYLIETRLSGGLTKIKSAIAIWATGATDTSLPDPTAPSYNASTGVVTIPTVANVTYKNADTGATLSSGAQTPLNPGQTLNVQAFANSGYFFPNDANTLFPFFRRS